MAGPTLPRLWGIHYSPYTDKARWVLDHHRVAYAYVEYTPLLGEPWLRARGAKSVPIFLDRTGSHEGSDVIARHAEAIGHGEPLFFDAAAVTEWEVLTAPVLTAGRALYISASLQDPRVSEEVMAGIVPQFALPHLHFLARAGTEFVARKHGLLRSDVANLDTLARGAERLAGALGGRDHLVGGRFSFADICGAALVYCLSPPLYLPLAPATRECWVRRELVTRFPELLRWRDGLVDRYRRPRESAT